MKYALDSLPKPGADPREKNDDLAGYYYAFGRLDQGAPPFIEFEGDAVATTTATAWTFGALYMQANREFNDNEHPRTYMGGIQACWENFVASGGETLDRKNY
jgi:hypothetical protein